MKTTCLLAILAVFALVGCQPAADAEAPANESAVSTPDGSDAVAAGMDMADVKKIKGAPNDTKHEHGAGGEEIDIWIYDDGEVRFVNGVTAE